MNRGYFFPIIKKLILVLLDFSFQPTDYLENLVNIHSTFLLLAQFLLQIMNFLSELLTSIKVFLTLFLKILNFLFIYLLRFLYFFAFFVNIVLEFLNWIFFNFRIVMVRWFPFAVVTNFHELFVLRLIFSDCTAINHNRVQILNYKMIYSSHLRLSFTDKNVERNLSFTSSTWFEKPEKWFFLLLLFHTCLFL